MDIQIPDGYSKVGTFEEFYRPDQVSSVHPGAMPGTLYKYRAWREKQNVLESSDRYDNHRAVLTDNILAFPSVQTFNDPFDSGIVVRFDLASQEFIEHWKDSLVEGMQPATSQERKILKDRTTFISAQEMSSVATDANWRHVGICSFAERKDNLLMWAHYSDCHRGICVGFDSYELQRYLHNYSIGIRAYRIHHAKMQYTHIVPEINPEDGMEDVRMLQVYCHKHTDWSYEEEHRLIYQSNARTGPVYPGRCITKKFQNNHITEVVIGLNNPYEDEIVDIARRKNLSVPIFKAVKNPSRFELEFHEVKY